MKSLNKINTELKKLKERLKFLKESAPFWKKELTDVNPDKINSFVDFAKAVPIFDKEKFRNLAFENAMDMDKILYQLMGEQKKDLRVIAATSGTTGEPTPYPLTSADLDMWNEANARMSWRCKGPIPPRCHRGRS